MTAETIHADITKAENAPPAEIARQTLPKSKRNHVIVILALLFTIGVSVWQYLITDNITRSLAPLRGAIVDVGLEVAEFHIWLEEVLQGDETISGAHIMTRLDAALTVVDSVIGDIRVSQDTFFNPPNREVLDAMLQLRAEVLEIRRIADQRIGMGEQGVSGTAIDQEFDAHYAIVIQAYERSKDSLNSHINDSLTRLSNISLFVITSSVALKMFIIALMLSSQRFFFHLITRLSKEISIAKRALDEAQRSQKAKSAFLAMMSHELRTPLNAIMGFSEMMKLEMFGKLEYRYKDYSHAIYQSAERFLALINTLINISRIESDDNQKNYEEIDVGTLLSDTCQLVSPRADDGGVSLSMDIDDDVQGITTDKKLFGDIVINLVHNAIKFTQVGGQVRLMCRRDGDGIALSIEDTGIGMTDEEIEMAMRAFSQLNPHLARSGEGSGLGLPLAKMATENLGGTFTISSQKGVGTRVDIWLPAQ